MPSFSFLRFRYSLRALLVVMTLFATPLAFYGYHISWIRQRHSAIESGEVDVFNTTSAPFPLDLYGELGYHKIHASVPVGIQVSEFKRRLTSIFSESEIHIDVVGSPKHISDGGEVLP